MESASGWDVLDTLVNTAGSVVSSKNAAQIAADTQNNATAVNAVASAQVAKTNNRTMLYVGIGAVLVIGAVLLLRR